MNHGLDFFGQMALVYVKALLFASSEYFFSCSWAVVHLYLQTEVLANRCLQFDRFSVRPSYPGQYSTSWKEKCR
ncbi:hypothetical protein, partial [Klebsiella pneumoniae]|uniref:hypothetical protein n=1 Tax=Klebsiella pneumoniae TaxID=573 RepID=UPI004055778A